MSELPKGWVETTLQDLCEFNPKHDPETDRATTVSFIPMPAVDDETGAIVDRSAIRPLSEVWKGYTHFADADVIFAKITPCMENGKIAVARDLENGMACGSTEFHVLRSMGAVEPDFVWRFLRQRSYRQVAERSMTGAVGQHRVPKPFLEGTMLPLPPLAEQKRIVAKLDALNAKSTRARTELARIETLVSRYKQAVLSKAYSGELTREWRNNQPSTTGWPKAVISDIAEVVTGSTPKTAEKERFFGGDTPFFKPTDLDQGYYVKTPRETLSAAGVAVSRLVPALSVLVTCIGATIGKVGFARVACCTNQQINALVPKIALAKPEWLYWVVTSPEFQAIIIDNSSATTLPIINKGRFQQLPLGLPPLEEQHEIVRRIESAFAKIDRLAKEAKRALELVGRLDEAILAKAFRGELVLQDENDEPAGHLLERIRAERQAAPKVKRGRAAKV